MPVVQPWRFGLHPQRVGEFLRELGWREVEPLGSAEIRARHVEGMALERFVAADQPTG